MAGPRGTAKLSSFETIEMDLLALGISLIVGGLAFLVSGLLFLLPAKRKILDANESFEESQARIEYYLQQMRESRGER